MSQKIRRDKKKYKKEKTNQKKKFRTKSAGRKIFVVEYQSEDNLESIDSVLIYKIIGGITIPVFDIYDFPEYQNFNDSYLIDEVMGK